MKKSSLLLLVVVSQALAAPLPVEVRASSVQKGAKEKFAPWRALDDSDKTSWCEGAPGEGVGQELALSFPAPRPLTKLKVTAVRQAGKGPQAVEVLIDDEPPYTLPLDPAGEMPLDGKAPARITVRLSAVTGGKKKPACLAEITLFEPDGADENTDDDPVAWLFGPAAEATAALPAYLAELTRAFVACDQAAFATLARFPLALRNEISEGDSTSIEKQTYKSAAALAKACSAESSDLPALGGEADVCRSVSPREIACTYVGSGLYEATFQARWKGGVWKLERLTMQGGD